MSAFGAAFRVLADLLGNYILSGGLETVLLIWQLESGSHNTLPHLGAPLEGITVSPSGSSYAVRLADNSTMILSTAELKPTFSVAGIQQPTNMSEQSQLPYVATVDAPEKSSQERGLQPRIVSAPAGLLCAVPSTVSSRVSSVLPQNAAYLQTLDLRSAAQISKQALTRTKATDLNLGPESNTIEEPNVILMQTSSGGDWLATVDEWTPPERDLAVMSSSDEQGKVEQGRRREIYLKFWSWNEEGRVYELASRIDQPHGYWGSLLGQHNGILDLVFCPDSYSAATVGEDGVVKIWNAQPRYRNGTLVRDGKGKQLLDWKCKVNIPISSGAVSIPKYTKARLAYSADRSCLAVACALPSSPWTVQILDPHLGTSTIGPYGPFTGPLYGLGILDQYLTILFDQLQVWNLVTERLVYGFALELDEGRLSTTPQMSLDTRHSTFAIALPEKGSTIVSAIIIFEPPNPKPICFELVPQMVISLTTLHESPGYVVVDSAAGIRTIVPSHSPTPAVLALPTPPETPSRSLGDIYGDMKTIDASNDQIVSDLPFHPGASHVEPHLDEDDVVVVTSEKLAETLDTGPAMPPVRELLERVARLFVGNREA